MYKKRKRNGKKINITIKNNSLELLSDLKAGIIIDDKLVLAATNLSSNNKKLTR